MSADIELFRDTHYGLETSLSMEVKAQGWVSLCIENDHVKTPGDSQISEVWLNLQEEEHRKVVKDLIKHLQHQLNIWEEQ